MEIRLINTWKDDQGLVFESIGVKNALLIANSVSLAGEPAHHLSILKQHSTLTIRQKMSLVLAYNIKQNKTELLEEIKQIEIVYSRIEKIKHKSNENFIRLKLIEKKFHEIYIRIIEMLEDDFQQSEYLNLFDFADNNQLKMSLFEFSSRGLYAPKSTPQKDAQKILDFVFSKNASGEPSVIMFPANYFRNFTPADSENQGEKIVESTIEEVDEHEEEEVEINSALQNCFRIPPLRHMTTLELKQFKNQLKDPIAAYNISMDNWINTVTDATKSQAQIESALEDVLKQSVDFDKQLNSNEWYKISLAQRNDEYQLASEIVISYAPTIALLEAFQHFKIFDVDVISKLIELTENNPKYPEYIPIISAIPCYWVSDEMSKREKLLESIGKPKGKKSISID